ncbi:lamin tail domain-containing protein [Nonomuraea sp. NPDC049714]|uniref:lamin tail domain-containing protein n=1 Tax=Nonomuraea sp. NPDC049714 TaxID=3364357 RepID=UPI00378C8313
MSSTPGVSPRVRSLLTAAVLAAGVVVAVSPPAHAAAPAVQITKIDYDSPGSPDSGQNNSLNGEYVQLKNMTKKAVSLRGWTMRDKTSRSDHVYTFGAFTLKAGKTVTLRTGRGKNTSTVRYWGRSGGGTFAYIWNQSSDTAYLRNVAGKLVDSCSYNSSRDDYKIC